MLTETDFGNNPTGVFSGLDLINGNTPIRDTGNEVDTALIGNVVAYGNTERKHICQFEFHILFVDESVNLIVVEPIVLVRVCPADVLKLLAPFLKDVKDFVTAHIPLVEKVVKNTERIGLKGNLLNSGSQSNHISKIKCYTLYTAKSVPKSGGILKELLGVR